MIVCCQIISRHIVDAVAFVGMQVRKYFLWIRISQQTSELEDAIRIQLYAVRYSNNVNAYDMHVRFISK